jgi:hypothetical protein
MSIDSRLLKLFAAISFILANAVLAWGQSSPGAVVQGQVVTSGGAAIANAMVQWSPVGVAGGGTTSSDPQGQFAFEVPISQGGVQVQISVTANLYIPAQTSVPAFAGQTTPVQIPMGLKPKTQLATVSGTLLDTLSHKGVPSATITILGAGGILSATTNSLGKFKIPKVGFNSNLSIQAETPEIPCIPTSTFPLSVSSTPVSVKLSTQIVHVSTPHCPDNMGINHQSPDRQPGPLLNIDDTLQWKQADTQAIQTNANVNAWNAGHVNDILRGPAGTGLITASDEGGVWLISENPGKSAIPVSDTWPSLTMNALAYGPDGSGHVYAGTYDYEPASLGGMLWETDTSAGFPLLNWYPDNPQPPCTSHTMWKILVIPEVRRIVLACDNGLFWSPIPSAPSVYGTYTWKMAVPATLAAHAFSGLAKGTGWIVGSGHEGSISASWYGGNAPKKILFKGAWKSGDLVLTPATVNDTTVPRGRTSMASCPKNENFMFAVAADGSNVNMSAIWQSTDGGITWNPTGSLPSNPGGQGSYNNVIAVSGDCSTVAVGWGGTNLSFDNGATWNPVTDSTPGYNHLHADVHALTFDPSDPSILFIGSDGGIVEASGLPTLPPALESDWSRDLLNLEFYPGAGSTSFAGLVAGAAQDNGVLYNDVPGGTWQHVTGCHCDGGQALFATPPGLPPGSDFLIEREWGAPNWPLDDVEAVNGSIPFSAQQDIHVNHTSETVNAEIAQAVRAPGGFLNATGEPMIAVDGDAQSLFGLFSMPDGSDMHWEQIGQLGGTETITAVAPTFNGSSTFVGTNAGNIFLFSAPYTSPALQLSVTPPEAASGRVSGLFAFFSTVAWASYNVGNDGYVMFFNGLSWNASGYGVLPNNLPFNSITARDLNTIFVSSTAAVYDSRDAGNTWNIANIGLPVNNTHLPLLYYLPVSPTGPGQLYLSTYGRSLWVTPVP